MQRLLWVDTETSGLDPNQGILFEVAFNITDPYLQSECSVNRTIKLPEGITLDSLSMSPQVKEMHERSGLFKEIETGITLVQASEFFEGWLKDHKGEQLCLAGSNPMFDRNWLTIHMPTVAKLFHYRSFDMNTLYYFFEIEKLKDGNRPHRAQVDIEADISVLRQIDGMLSLRNWVKHGVKR